MWNVLFLVARLKKKLCMSFVIVKKLEKQKIFNELLVFIYYFLND